MRISVFATCLFVAWLNCSSFVSAQTIYVTTGQDVVDGGDGLISLREAVDEVNAGNYDTILFSGVTDVVLDMTIPGVAPDIIGDDLDITQTDVTIDGGVDIKGNPKVTIRPDLSAANLDEYACFFVHVNASADIKNIKLEGFFTGPAHAAVADDLALPFTHHGSAISNWGELYLNNVHFCDNHTENSGGAIYNTSEITINQCDFIGNYAGQRGPDGQADSRGGAIYNHDTNRVLGNSICIILECLFEDNESFGPRGGGAIFNFNEDAGWTGTIPPFSEPDASANLLVSESTFTENKAYFGSGGAIYTYRAGFNIDKCSFNGNFCAFDQTAGHGEDSYERGGAIYTNAATDGFEMGVQTVISNSTFYENKARRGGAIMFYLDQRSRLYNCTFYANEAAYNGGAIVYASCTGQPTIDRCTIYGNVISPLLLRTANGHLREEQCTPCDYRPSLGRAGGIYADNDVDFANEDPCHDKPDDPNDDHPGLYDEVEFCLITNTILDGNKRDVADLPPPPTTDCDDEDPPPCVLTPYTHEEDLVDSNYMGLFSPDSNHNLLGKPDWKGSYLNDKPSTRQRVNDMWFEEPDDAYMIGVLFYLINGDDTIDDTANHDPQLFSLHDYGGPTKTLMPAPLSPARYNGDAASMEQDQRGEDRDGTTTDIGAVERQNGDVTTDPNLGK